ncbi:MAG: protein phosphatase 2C domain-containing protein [Oscillospiraceae bacterium]|jgi:protein phosphatase|nr:protein phosphatase 2C domain-containing protein [Oscillospiraceae bacterium]
MCKTAVLSCFVFERSERMTIGLPLKMDFFINNWWILAIAAGILLIAALWLVWRLMTRNKKLRRRLERKNRVDAALAPEEALPPLPTPASAATTIQLTKVNPQIPEPPEPEPQTQPVFEQPPAPAPKKKTTIQIPTLAPEPPVIESKPPEEPALSHSGPLRIRYATGSFMHIGTRKSQQDALYVSSPRKSPLVDGEPVLLGVLCDGMGGMENGEAASKLAVNTMVKAFFESFDAGDIPLFLENAARAADRLVDDTLSGGGDSGAGTTMVSVIISHDQLYWLSVGDSRIYILRNHEIVQVTRDHNFRLLLNEKVEAGEMTEDDVENNKDKEALISYLGMGGLELVDINRQPFQLIKDDIILLCSDGLTKSLSGAQIQRFIMENSENPLNCARVLANKAFECRKDTHQDNTSVIIIRYTG